MMAVLIPDKKAPGNTDLKWQTCPRCKKEFQLVYSDYLGVPQTVDIRRFPYDGGCGDIRSVTIICPHCERREELY